MNIIGSYHKKHAKSIEYSPELKQKIQDIDRKIELILDRQVKLIHL